MCYKSLCLGLCSWVINIVKFYEVFCDVEPKRRALDEANAELEAAQDKLEAIKNQVRSFGSFPKIIYS